MPKTLLYLEDQEGVSAWICDFIRTEGYECITVSEPTEAKEVLSRAEDAGEPGIDGIVADLKMKDPDSTTPDVEDVEVGVWFLYWVRQQEVFRDLPIVVLSIGASDRRMPGWQHLLRISSAIQKPTTGKELGRALINAFGRP